MLFLRPAVLALDFSRWDNSNGYRNGSGNMNRRRGDAHGNRSRMRVRSMGMEVVVRGDVMMMVMVVGSEGMMFSNLIIVVVVV